MEVKTKPLTPRQDLFCREFLVDLNASAAYRRAGYTASKRSAEVNASRLLADPRVAARVRQLLDERAARVDVKADEVLRELQRIGFFDLRKAATWGGDSVQLIPSTELDDDTARAIVEVSSERRTFRDREGNEIETVNLKLKMANKLQALEKLGQHLGLWDTVQQRQTPTPPAPATYRGRDMSQPRAKESREPKDGH